MPHKMDEVHRIKEDGWRQGSVLPSALIEKIRTIYFNAFDIKKDDLVIIISHSCDVTHGSLEREPYVELLILRAVTKKDGSIQWGKNPRLYQIQEKQILFNILVHERVNIPRENLIGYMPDLGRAIDPKNIIQITRWIANRYRRADFPDEFNNRINTVLNELRKLLKKEGGIITGIYVLVEDEEYPPEKFYSIILHATMFEDDYQIPESRKLALEIMGKIEAILGDCQGISLEKAEILSEKDISLDDLRKFKRWDFDDLSLRSGALSDIPPEK